MMYQIIFCAFIASALCHDVFKFEIPAQQKVKITNEVNSVICPDNHSQCGDGQTCCELSDGSYGCCPYPSATCCCDHLHCCPGGTTCNLAAGTCDAGNRQIVPLLKKLPSEKIEAIICPDGASQCQNSQTCCQQPDGTYTCCNYPSATCCSDHIHCCPHATTCNFVTKSCDRGNIPIAPLLKKRHSQKIEAIICPDGQSQCRNDQTCCQLADGSYGCCPDPNAVCCADRLHCCPHGSVCNLADGKCEKGNEQVVPLSKKLPSKKVKSILCPDCESHCENGETCCQLPGGNYGCCPFPSATCCSDHLHCCPHGTTCNVNAGTCDAGNRQIAPLLTKASAQKVEAINCPDGQTQCSNGQTCCQLQDGSYGCCPYPSATCCSDHLHCCPHGTTCNLAAGTCDGLSRQQLMLLRSLQSKKPQ